MFVGDEQQPTSVKIMAEEFVEKEVQRLASNGTTASQGYRLIAP
jgi:hypothetical protein